VPLAADKEWRGQEERSTTCRDKCREVTVYDSGTTRHFKCGTYRRTKAESRSQVPSEPAGVAAHHVSEDSGVSRSRVSPAWALPWPGRFWRLWLTGWVMHSGHPTVGGVMGVGPDRLARVQW
jgi:hypothetical protein